MIRWAKTIFATHTLSAQQSPDRQKTGNPLNTYLGSKRYNMYNITTSKHYIPAKIQIHNVYRSYVQIEQIEAGDKRKKNANGYSNSRGRFREMCDCNSTVKGFPKVEDAR